MGYALAVLAVLLAFAFVIFAARGKARAARRRAAGAKSAEARATP
jgi:hypothetical protein